MQPFCVFAALDSFKVAEKAALFAETSFVSTTSTPRDCIAFRACSLSTNPEATELPPSPLRP